MLILKPEQGAGLYGPKVFEARFLKPFWLGVVNLNARYMGG